MKALIRGRYGSPDVLELRDIRPAGTKEREVLVQVHAGSINDWDWQMLQKPMLPLLFNTPRIRILGSDIAGRVAAVGNGVQHFSVGDEVSTAISRASGLAAGADLRNTCVHQKSRCYGSPLDDFRTGRCAAASRATRGARFLLRPDR